MDALLHLQWHLGDFFPKKSDPKGSYAHHKVGPRARYSLPATGRAMPPPNHNAVTSLCPVAGQQPEHSRL